MPKAGVAQFTGSVNHEENIAAVRRLAAKAAEAGVNLLCFFCQPRALASRWPARALRCKASRNFQENKSKKAPRYSLAIARPVTAPVCAIHSGRLI